MKTLALVVAVPLCACDPDTVVVQPLPQEHTHEVPEHDHPEPPPSNDCYVIVEHTHAEICPGGCEHCTAFVPCPESDRFGQACWVSGELLRCADPSVDRVGCIEFANSDCLTAEECSGCCPGYSYSYRWVPCPPDRRFGMACWAGNDNKTLTRCKTMEDVGTQCPPPP